jgi:replicative DNA helicase
MAELLELPSNLDAERSVLGGLLIDQTHLDDVAQLVKPKDFYLQTHQGIWAAILKLHARGTPLDVLTLSDALGPDADPTYLSRLMNDIPRLLNVPWYARIVVKASKQRAAVIVAHRFADEVASSDDPARLLDSMAAGLSVLLHDETEPAESIQDVLAGYLDHLEERVTGQEKLDWLGTGFACLDALVGGWCPGELIIVAARPSVGKTAFALSSARHRAESRGVLFFSSEMTSRAIGERLLAMEARIDLQRLRLASQERQLSEAEWGRLVAGFARIKGLDLSLDDKPAIGMRHVRSAVRERQLLRAKGGLPPLADVVIDYLQLLQGPGATLREAVTEIAKGAKQLAREENVAVVMLSQLRRPDSKKAIPPPPPHVHELKEAGAIEENADVVIMLDRPELYLEAAGRPVGEHASVAWAHVAKQRQGPVGRVMLGFRKDATLFSDPWWPATLSRSVDNA